LSFSQSFFNSASWGKQYEILGNLLVKTYLQGTLYRRDEKGKKIRMRLEKRIEYGGKGSSYKID